MNSWQSVRTNLWRERDNIKKNMGQEPKSSPEGPWLHDPWKEETPGQTQNAEHPKRLHLPGVQGILEMFQEELKEDSGKRDNCAAHLIPLPMWPMSKMKFMLQMDWFNRWKSIPLEITQEIQSINLYSKMTLISHQSNRSAVLPQTTWNVLWTKACSLLKDITLWIIKGDLGVLGECKAAYIKYSAEEVLRSFTQANLFNAKF